MERGAGGEGWICVYRLSMLGFCFFAFVGWRGEESSSWERMGRSVDR